MVIILVVTGFAIVLTASILTLNVESNRSEEATLRVYDKDTVIETAKYGIANELNNLKILAFDATTPVLTTMDIQSIETKINTAINELSNDYSITLESENPVLVDSVCDNLYSYDTQGTPIYEGMYCDYIPITINLKVTVLDKEGKPKDTSIVSTETLYLYEDSNKISVDDTLVETKLY
jgi:hypothetical protein